MPDEQNALLHYDDQRYVLHAWVVMPNHVHTLYTPRPDWELSQITRTWKSYTANECNKILNRKGEFWQQAMKKHCTLNLALRGKAWALLLQHS